MDIEAALRKKLRELLHFPNEQRALLLLEGFIEAYKLRDKIKRTNNRFKKLWYKIRFANIIVPGYILDVRVNYTVGRKLFGDYVTWPTLTATLKRVKKKAPHNSKAYQLAVQVCQVLDLYDPGHC